MVLVYHINYSHVYDMLVWLTTVISKYALAGNIVKNLIYNGIYEC